MKFEREIPIGLDAQRKKRRGGGAEKAPPPPMGLGLIRISEKHKIFLCQKGEKCG